MCKSKYVRKEFTPIQCAYLAGIIDGEGSIHIGCFTKPTIYRKSPHYQTYIGVTNTSEDIINWLFDTFGGAKRAYTPKQTPKNARKKVYQWNVWSDQLLHICELIQPYVIIKKREVEIMIEMRKTYKTTVFEKGYQGVPRVSEEILSARSKCLKEIRSLHQRNYAI